MKKFLKWGIVAVIALLLVACHRNTIKGSGKVITQTRNVSAFENVRAAGEIKLSIIVGKTPLISVRTDDNLQPYILTTVKDNTLEITAQKGYQLVPSTPINVEVDVNKLKSLSTSGSIQAGVIGVDGDNFDVRGTGNSDLVLDGKVNKASITIAGKGRVDARRLITEEMNLYVDGAASANVYASRKLDVRVAGTGQVVYFGNPPFLNQSIFGKGSVEKGSGNSPNG